MDFSTGLYYCGTILLVLAFLSIALGMELHSGSHYNQDVWEEINTQILEDEEAEDD